MPLHSIGRRYSAFFSFFIFPFFHFLFSMFPFFVLLDVSREKSHITGKVPGGRLPRPFLNSRTRTINLILSFIAYSLNKDTLESFILLFFHHKRQFVYHISVEGSKALSRSLLNWYYLCSPLRYSRLNSWWNDDGYDSCPPPPPQMTLIWALVWV